MRQQLESFDEREIDRVEAIVRSMTPHERVAPKIINGSRRARIAKGSGVTVSEVNQLMERFAQAQKIMKKPLSPEPWFAAYVQPSRRSKDGRYGDNPNRLQHYYQFQVALKPAPANIQDLYLDSLRELGIDPIEDRKSVV